MQHNPSPIPREITSPAPPPAAILAPSPVKPHFHLKPTALTKVITLPRSPHPPGWSYPPGKYAQIHVDILPPGCASPDTLVFEVVCPPARPIALSDTLLLVSGHQPPPTLGIVLSLHALEQHVVELAFRPLQGDRDHILLVPTSWMSLPWTTRLRHIFTYPCLANEWPDAFNSLAGSRCDGSRCDHLRYAEEEHGPTADQRSFLLLN
ncbi:hypothetical protein FA95DRAFT_1577604 [Auriscalpium vulgare]|uniref:Uncharacterized protein n=1 Tax=Auriscalpium vulgare TaxID=40419 RepID=A0ACB8R5L5_9AGAM|nr:hypothetical protein FA95DRAFT_1577604 [Auriscalpium vulgare]